MKTVLQKTAPFHLFNSILMFFSLFLCRLVVVDEKCLLAFFPEHEYPVGEFIILIKQHQVILLKCLCVSLASAKAFCITYFTFPNLVNFAKPFAACNVPHEKFDVIYSQIKLSSRSDKV
jgi:uncharacterized membrane protein YbhN (UPF0104 family)